jgi:hypothetical protein
VTALTPNPAVPTQGSTPWIRMGWAVFILAILWASLNIPRFSDQRMEKGVVWHPRLFPYYFQTNVDATLELSTALGWPEYYKVAPNRVNRPVVYALIAGLREFVASPLVSLAAGKDAGSKTWGPWTVRDHLLTYFIWIVLNLGMLTLSALMFHRLVRSHFGGMTGSLAAILLLSSPILLLSLREIHLTMYHLLVGMACLAFWHAVLLGGPMSKTRLAWLSLGIGALFLGKFCFNVFAAGALLCLLAGQWRKLFLILPAVALPTAVWFLMTKPLGYVYGVSEVSDCGAGVWLLQVESFGNLLREIAAFLSQWFKCLGESASVFHLPFAALGAYGLWKNGGRMFLGVALLAALVDMGFYFLVHRNNANYGMSTLLFFFVLVALGIQSALVRVGSRWPVFASGRFAAVTAVALILAIQLALNWRQLPQYGG